MKDNWNKDFKKIKYPTVESFLSNNNESDIYSKFNIVIGVSVGEYPMFVVSFNNYLACKSHEETEFEFDSFVKDDAFKETNSIILHQSDWMKSMFPAINFLHENKKMRHFIFSGGDNIVEVITDSEPVVQVFYDPHTFEFKI